MKEYIYSNKRIIIIYYINIDKWLKIYKKDLNNVNDFKC